MLLYTAQVDASDGRHAVAWLYNQYRMVQGAVIHL
jgi:hypothetical protein